MIPRSLSRYCAVIVALVVQTAQVSASPSDDGRKLVPLFEQQVKRRLNVPPPEQERYAQLLTSTLEDDGISPLSPQYLIVVDRSPRVQAAMIFWKSPDGPFYFIGATPVSTGLPGTYEHFLTPLGIYRHTIGHPDFRAEGTRNEFGIRGYGVRGMRIFDFGWIAAPRGWGDHALGRLRLQMHATDPDRLDARLGTAQSEGCVRTTASFDRFVDHYGILDGDYEQAAKKGQHESVLSSDREPTPWSGRYFVVVDTQRETRPAWANARTPPKNPSK